MIWRRVRIYAFGVGLGCMMVYVFLIRGKNRDFGFWLPENRIIEELTTSKITYSDQATCALACYSIAADSVKTIIQNSNVNYDRSLPRENPRKYYIEGQNFDTYVQIDRKHNLEILSLLQKKQAQACDCK